MILTKGVYDLWEKRFEVKQFEVEDDGSLYKIIKTSDLSSPEYGYRNGTIAKSTPDIVFPGKRTLEVETLVEDNPVEHLQDLIKEYFANLARFENTVTYLLSNKSIEKKPILTLFGSNSGGYEVKENTMKELQAYFLERLIETNYTPTEVDLSEMARQMAVHYAVFIESKDLDKSFVDKIASFDSLKESADWFWEQIEEEIDGYDGFI